MMAVTRSMAMTLAALLLGLLGAAEIGWAQDDPRESAAAQADSAADAEWKELQDDFLVLYRSFNSAMGFTEEERPTVESLLSRAERFAADHPEHAGAVAMQIQLRQWLNKGVMDDATKALYRKLVDLRPNDAAIALKWMEVSLGELEPQDPQRVEVLRDLLDRFPDEPVIAGAWVDALRNQMRYQEMIGFLEARELDPAEDPELVYELASAYFAAHRFSESLSTAESIPIAALRGQAELNSQIAGLKADALSYVDFWEVEQRLRNEAENEPIIEMYTDKGRIVLQLFEDHAPNTVANFISLAQDGFYADTAFHRFLPDFMIQGGDPNTKPGNEGAPGLGGPGYYIPDEHMAQEDQPEPRKHFNDSLAMAKTSAPNTAGSQFYLTHRPTPWLNDQHTVFGYVIEGRDVALSLREGDRINEVRVISKREHDYEPRTIPRPDASPPADAAGDDDAETNADDAGEQAQTEPDANEVGDG